MALWHVPLPRTQVKQGATRGFTAIELMVTLAILGVLMALAGPSFAQWMESWRVRQATEQLRDTLQFARSEAIKRSGQVVIQKIPNNTNGCTSAPNSSDWGCGWTVCHDTNNSGTCTAADTLLQRIDAPRAIEVTRSSGAASIKFNRWGLVAGSYLGFNIVPLDKNISHPGARGLCMSSGGRIRVVLREDIPCNS